MCGLALLCAVAVVDGCASSERVSVPSAIHVVRPGENLYRIGLRYGVPVDMLVRANDIRDVTELPVGTQLRIPDAGSRTPRAAPKPGAQAAARKRARAEAKERARVQFQWPIRGRLTSGFGPRNGRPHEGIDLAARKGAAIHTAESGKVVYSGRLGDYGKVVVVKHAGPYKSVYAHASALHVRKGQLVERGQRIAAVGTTGRASGPHLHFEIRDGRTARDPILYLP